jgi:alcohol dehydrogenase
MNLALGQHAFSMKTQVEYGPDVFRKAGSIIKQSGCKKTLLVTDGNFAKTGLIEKVSQPIREMQIAVEVFDQVTSEPTDAIVQDGVARLKESKCDFIVALGGGSAMDAAKCIGVMAENPGRLVDYEGAESNFPNDAKCPLMTLPTTSGSGAEIAGWAVITDTSRNYKMSLGSPCLTPDYALVDPVLTLDLPPAQTAYSGFDALSQAIEGMLSKRRTPISLALGMYAVKLISENLPRAVARGWDLEARSNMSTGSLIAGIVINISGCIAVHSLAETIGGMYHKPHGLCVALFLPHVMKFNFPGDYLLLAQIAQALGVDTDGYSTRDAAELSIFWVNQLLDDLKFPELGEIGLREEDIPRIAQLAYQNVCTADNPRPMRVEDFESILIDALQDQGSSN